MSDKLCGEFVMRMFHSRTNAHLQHLMTRSYAAHKALNEYYDGIIPLADSFIEAYQGRHGIETGYPKEYTMEMDSVAMLTGLRKWIDDNRNKITALRELQNIIDEVLNLIDSTVYKLRFLT